MIGKFLSSLLFILKLFLRIVSWIVFVTLPFYLLFLWNFKYIDKLVEFFKYSLWPLIALTFLFMFKGNIERLIDETKELIIFGNTARREKLPEQEIQKTEEKTPSESVSNLKKEIAKKNEELGFEKIFHIIFGTQLDLLEQLIGLNRISLADLTSYYSSVQKKHSVFILHDWSLSDYIRFLVNSALIEVKLDGYQITQKGKDFMKYLKDSGYNLKVNLN